MSYSLDVENFISEVRKRPALWNIHCEEYRFKVRKQRAWDEIGAMFITDFEDLSNPEKLDVYRKLHGKWRNIRDSYVRCIRRPGGGKAYMYSKLLTFLDDVYRPQNSDSDNHHNSSQSDDEKPLKPKKRKSSIKLALKNTNAWSEDETLKPKKEEPNNLEYVETQFGEPFSYGTTVEDEDRSFFDSLLPAVRSFDLDQKLEFRSQILTLIKEIRNSKTS